MTPDQLSDFLLSHQLPVMDCNTIKGWRADSLVNHSIILLLTEHGIGGAVFQDFTADDWKEFGISRVGIAYIRRIKEKVRKGTHELWL